MRPGLAREIVRNSTAYSAGRSLANGLMVGYILAGFIVAVWLLRIHGLPETPEDLLACAGPFLAVVVGGTVAVLLRELAHAVFDMADVALNRPDPER